MTTSLAPRIALLSVGLKSKFLTFLVTVSTTTLKIVLYLAAFTDTSLAVVELTTPAFKKYLKSP